MPDDPEAILEAINDRAITWLVVPEGDSAAPPRDREPAAAPQDREALASARDRIVASFSYSPTGRVAEHGDVRIAGNEVDRVVRTRRARSRGRGRDARPRGPVRRGARTARRRGCAGGTRADACRPRPAAREWASAGELSAADARPSVGLAGVQLKRWTAPGKTDRTQPAGRICPNSTSGESPVPRDPKYDILFEPIQLGPKTLKNRFYQVPTASARAPRSRASRPITVAIKAEGGWGAVLHRVLLDPSRVRRHLTACRRGSGTRATCATSPSCATGCTSTARWPGSSCGTAGPHAPCMESRATPRGPSQIPSDFELNTLPAVHGQGRHR